jgi:rhodanese-related sulfurtransferase
MIPALSVTAVKDWLQDGGELALLDVRERGQIGEGHLLWSVATPFSRFEAELCRLVPNPATRLLLIDEGDGLAERAADRAQALGYGTVAILAGGVPAWTAAGGRVFQGVNVASKAFGELVEHTLATPSIGPEELAARREAGEALVILDGRPFEEYSKMTIPGSRCCPNGELPFRITALVPDASTTVVINCAGRTRSILGTEILRSIGLPNPVLALRNGTMGWELAGYAVERGADRRYGDGTDGEALQTLVARTRELARRAGVARLSATQAVAWLANPGRTTYVFDVRTAEEYRQSHLPGVPHAPGGQLIQATDQWVGVRGARLLLLDDQGERAPVVAAWLAVAGWETAILDQAQAAWPDLADHLSVPPKLSLPALPVLTAAALGGLPGTPCLLLDLRGSLAFRAGHIAGAHWAIRSRLPGLLSEYPLGKPIVLVATDPVVAQLAAQDIAALGHPLPFLLEDGPDGWAAAGLPVDRTPDLPADQHAIDHLFFTHDRHAGNLDAARRYLDWETGLVDQLEDLDRQRLLTGLARLALPRSGR